LIQVGWMVIYYSFEWSNSVKSFPSTFSRKLKLHFQMWRNWQFHWQFLLRTWRHSVYDDSLKFIIEIKLTQQA
jgi:hypothetical protein